MTTRNITMRTINIIASLLAAFMATSSYAQMETRDTRIGTLQFEKGYPSDSTVEKLYDEMDFQRASQAYIWGLPVVSSMNLVKTVLSGHDADYTNLIGITTFEDLSYGITANATTPYYFVVYDLNKLGPAVFEEPAGATAGFIDDLWQRPVTDLGVPGKFAGKGGKHLVLGPGQKAPSDDKGYHVVQSKTNQIVGILRNLETDTDKAKNVINAFQIYPYSKRVNPPKTKIIAGGGRKWASNQPRGMAFWQLLSDAINSNPVEERDGFFMAMLKPLGIEKGKPFNPTASQKKILEEAVFVGEAMAMANDFEKRGGMGHYADGTAWDIALTTNIEQQSKYYAHLDERAAWFYEAYSTSKGMTTQKPGVGSIYLSTYKDTDGQWLDGAKSYRLQVPANVPAKNFWSVTVYHNDTRYLIQNKQQRADRSSRMDLLKNADGTVDIYFGPTAPEGKDQNWIPTNSDEGWFPYFRLYGPLEAYFDRSWILPSIERVK